MSDDIWRRRNEGDEDVTSDIERGSGELLSFDDDSGALPHWTEPPTGEIPRLRRGDATGGSALDDDLDVWSSFTTESPVWRDEAEGGDASGEVRMGGGLFDSTDQLGGDSLGDISSDISREVARDTSRDYPRDFTDEFTDRQPSGRIEATGRPVREPARITIGTDPSGMPRQPAPRSRRSGPPPRPGRPAGPARTAAQASGRDMPAAVAVGLILAAVFIASLLLGPLATVVFVTAILTLAAWEFFSRVTEKGYRPPIAAGVLGVVGAAAGAYWSGETALPLVVALAFVAGAVSFTGARGVESGPLPNMAVTSLGVVWIGLLGSFAPLIVRFSNEPVASDIGTDTMFLLALGVVANDIGALFIGSAAGRTPLRPWISPHKTVEGLMGGTVFTFLVLYVLSILDRSTTWNSAGDLLLLAAVISVMAPLGDLVESMFKRNLDVKDFGNLVRGHGGLLDRFDAFLFCLPAVYYLMRLLEPWTS
jgi:phosphatidate cytidylyltransferase